jgi:uncharacterized protein
MSTRHSYRPRLLDRQLRQLLSEFPAIMINGPRSTGKSTTARQLTASTLALDSPGTRRLIQADPDGALRRQPGPLLIDEWQEVPEILPAIKRAIDRNGSPGQFILTGRVRAELTTDMWAGTVRVIRQQMYSLTERELSPNFDPLRPSFVERLTQAGFASNSDSIEELFPLPQVCPTIDDYVQLALRSGFPDAVWRIDSQRGQALWLRSYLDDLVTRDAVALAGSDSHRLRRFISALAINTAGLPTDQSLYEAAGINARTAAQYETLLERLYLLEQIPAWSGNCLKSLVMAKKRYLIDPGLVAAALKLTAEDVLYRSDLLDRIFDTFGYAQIRPELGLSYPEPTVHHVRTRNGRQEIDLVLELSAGKVIGIEFKAGVAPGPADAKHLLWLADQLGPQFIAGAVLHSGRHVYPLGARIWAIPLCAIWC